METYAPKSSLESISVITSVEFESADKNDANALLPANDQSGAKEMVSRELLAYFLYGGDNNCESAKTEYEVEVIAPLMGKTPKGLGLEDFTVDDSGRIITCSQGCSPEKRNARNSVTQHFF